MDITLWLKEMHIFIWTTLVPKLYQEEPGLVATWPQNVQTIDINIHHREGGW